MPNQRQVQDKLDTVEGLVELTSEQKHAVEALLEAPGLIALLGLLVSARQGFYLQLANMNLATDAGRHHAAVIQGQIKGIDLIPQTLLEVFPPAEGR